MWLQKYMFVPFNQYAVCKICKGKELINDAQSIKFHFLTLHQNATKFNYTEDSYRFYGAADFRVLKRRYGW